MAQGRLSVAQVLHSLQEFDDYDDKDNEVVDEASSDECFEGESDFQNEGNNSDSNETDWDEC